MSGMVLIDREPDPLAINRVACPLK